MTTTPMSSFLSATDPLSDSRLSPQPFGFTQDLRFDDLHCDLVGQVADLSVGGELSPRRDVLHCDPERSRTADLSV